VRPRDNSDVRMEVSEPWIMDSRRVWKMSGALVGKQEDRSEGGGAVYDDVVGGGDWRLQ
jgi:hypothetical protein